MNTTQDAYTNPSTGFLYISILAMFGTLIHLGIDAALLSAFLAGIRRTTGLTFVVSMFTSWILFDKFIPSADRSYLTCPTRMSDVSFEPQLCLTYGHSSVLLIAELLRSYLEFGM